MENDEKWRQCSGEMFCIYKSLDGGRDNESNVKSEHTGSDFTEEGWQDKDLVVVSGLPHTLSSRIPHFF